MVMTNDGTLTVCYVPGSTQLARALREERTDRYRTWHGSDPELGWWWECLLCGEWNAQAASREAAVIVVSRAHPSLCHVLVGCYCLQPHLTAEMAARIGIKDNYPADRAAELFRMAGGVRRYRPAEKTLDSTLISGPEFGSGGYQWTR
jgi:hypothetical protein